MSVANTLASKTRSGSATRQRSGMVNFRATEGERFLIEAAADKAGLSVGAYVRSCVLTNPATRGTRRAPVDRAALAQLLGLIGRAGSNLNQIARSENRGRDEPMTGEAIQAASQDLRAMKAELMVALGRIA